MTSLFFETLYGIVNVPVQVDLFAKATFPCEVQAAGPPAQNTGVSHGVTFVIKAFGA